MQEIILRREVMEIVKENPEVERIAEYLINRFKTDTDLENFYEKNKITLRGVCEHVRNKAKKLAKNGCAVVEDNEVFNWVVDYIIEKKEVVNQTEIEEKQEIKVQPKAEKKVEEKPTQMSIFEFLE